MKIDTEKFLDRCRELRVLVIGDLMLDRYLWGKVERISPEAPIPVVDILREESRPGGAANVGMNLRALGAETWICGLTGDDGEGDLLIDLLRENGFNTNLVLRSEHRPTTTKTRIIGNNQQVLRVDKEHRGYLRPEKQRRLLQKLEEVEERIDAVIFEDYDKGLLNPELIREITGWARGKGILVSVDPKFSNFFEYEYCDLFKPNLKELNEALGMRLDGVDTAAVREAAMELRERMEHRMTLVTLGSKGMLLVDEDGAGTHVPAHVRNITDVSGAGDTVISVMTLGLAAGLAPHEAALAANLAGGLVCEQVGVVPVNIDRLREEMSQ